MKIRYTASLAVFALALSSGAAQAADAFATCQIGRAHV